MLPDIDDETRIALAFGVLHDAGGAMHQAIKRLTLRPNASHATRSEMALIRETQSYIVDRLKVVEELMQKVSTDREREVADAVEVLVELATPEEA